jgi:hypothetical protein
MHWPFLMRNGNIISGQKITGRVNEFQTDEFRKYVSQHPYLKLSIAFPLLQWNDMHEQIREAYIDLGKLIS